ncbi:MAG TPA: bifunctional glutamate N-acetyltransferase/amino-acid acetyltransferase ArgJ [Solirubrobacteraceae bacterium]|nr:bifunctional glutamate N-acetyltransferase/amino-acid acetyltransferase ArgJ [Solirubrobacteraceae bacterium]
MTALFDSRWAQRPDGVAELDPATLPAGFVAGAAAAGVKGEGSLDVGVLHCLAPEPVSAARFGDSSVPAAPVLVCRGECDLARVRAVVANSGNANAATGDGGVEQARLVQIAGANALGLEPREVAVASTGVIGVLLPGERIAASLSGIAPRLSAHGAADLAAAIRTTDRLEKHASLSVELPSGAVTLSAQAKGAGMISPHFATMLCFIETDAALTARTADRLLGAAVRRSFDRVSVDGQLSTNDTAVLIASGASGVEVGAGDEPAFAAALDALLLALALLMVRDGEGARRVARVAVSGADSEPVARAIANSPLVKAALFGGDPNWGRIAQAIGGALRGRDPFPFAIAIEGVSVCRGGAALDVDRARLARAVDRDEVEYAVALPGEGAATLYFSDLSYDYVKINAEYTT